ncbi:dienelactone hydrolase family protein [Rhizobacter sp. Root1221]|uniref:dienelactone hydrolase family protein n=1 Tax=Rhizobacter sp. Root1221 TaxID=1736433 RepID=UPI0006FDA572|nr:dienelactone hydrolase family protein [Rhizobacter sp. Root1221]KQV85555.1 carboxymethylenebutenolidase [Rhizobacter sp. Root1221]
MTIPTPASFATAVQPVVAGTLVITPDTGLRHGDITIGGLPAYFASPEGTGPFPIVLVVQEIFGVHEHIRDVVRRFAKAGYLAVAPELYHRLGRAQDAASVDELRANFVAKAPDATVLSDLDATLAWAEGAGGDPTRAAITGFCWGGRITWLYAAHQPKLRAAVAWYGRLAGPTDALHPRNPIELAADLKAPVLGLYGAEDPGIPLPDVDRLNAALKEAGTPSTIHVYPAAPHAFFADYRPSYRPEAAQDGWRRALAWFRQHGV